MKSNIFTLLCAIALIAYACGGSRSVAENEESRGDDTSPLEKSQAFENEENYEFDEEETEEPSENPENWDTENTFVVNSADEFIEAIGSDRVILLKKAIDFSDISSRGSGKNYRFDPHHDGQELVIIGAKNLKIEGFGDKPVEIITEPRYGNVLVFENCRNITIENLNAGHGPEKGYCTGGVFKITNSRGITINNSIMYGSGIEGITAENVSRLQCSNSTIRGCTYSIMTLNDCKNFTFYQCKFTENEEFDLVNITNSNNVVFDNCNFSNNRTGESQALFNVNEVAGVALKDCTVRNNVAGSLSNNANAIEWQDTKIHKNKFRN